jgi:serine/threonine protein kinase
VTPGNLLLSTGPDGRPRVLIADLGVAKSMIDAVGATMTAGTPSYMAPEQAAGKLPLDRRADIYSLTAVSYAMLTGKAPFPVRSIADILARDPGLQPEPVAARLNAPPTLDAVMISGLAYDRNRRPPTALLLADGLETIAAQLEAGASGIWSTVSTVAGPTGPRTGPPVMPPPPPEATMVTWPSSISQQPGPSRLAGAPDSANQSASPTSELQSFAEGYADNADGYATSMVGDSSPDEAPLGRGGSYYAMLGVGALALFAISMFVTILLLR